MNRTVLVIVAVVLLLFGIGRVGTGLMMLLAMHAAGPALLVYVLFYLGVGGGAIAGGVLILRGQLRDGGDGGKDEEVREAARRDMRRGLKIAGIIVALLIGCAGLLLSLCGGIMMQGNMGSGSGGILGIGLLLTVVAIAVLVWAIRK